MSPRLMPMRNSSRRPADIGVARGHVALHLDGAAHRIDDAGEFDEKAVAGGFDDAPVTLADPRVGDLMPPRSQPGERRLLVLAH
jgi:hypothetical protein